MSYVNEVIELHYLATDGVFIDKNGEVIVNYFEHIKPTDLLLFMSEKDYWREGLVVNHRSKPGVVSKIIMFLPEAAEGCVNDRDTCPYSEVCDNGRNCIVNKKEELE